MVDTRFYINNGPFALAKVAEICGAELKQSSKAQIMIENIAPMEKAQEAEICFFYDKKAKKKQLK